MENTRTQAIQEFMKMTEELITESKCKQTKNHTKLATTAIKYLIAHVKRLRQKGHTIILIVDLNESVNKKDGIAQRLSHQCIFQPKKLTNTHNSSIISTI